MEHPRCERCSEPFYGAIEPAFTCPNCGGRLLHLDCAVAAWLSRGIVRRCIHLFKYQRALYLRHELAAWAAAAFADPRIAGEPADALVPVPLHRVREREREFNQADVLARLLGDRFGLPVQPFLERTRYTSTQTALHRDERMENLRGAFRVKQNAVVCDMRLILVDDVLTTGSTLDECARELKAGGARSVRAVTVARG